jgi:hypothetical protein
MALTVYLNDSYELDSIDGPIYNGTTDWQGTNALEDAACSGNFLK